jgi:fumarylacetoacetate (FAA) hydrolase
VGHDAIVCVPPGCSELDYELEVAAVIGLGGADIRVEEADRHIAGYCIMNDWSARDVQRVEARLGFGFGKSKDFATTLGPYLVTPDELQRFRAGTSLHLSMTASVNGIEYSRASLKDMYWSFAEIVEYGARSSRVEPGDIFGSGTCGTGCILELSSLDDSGRYPWLCAGNRVELTVEGLGTLGNTVVATASMG